MSKRINSKKVKFLGSLNKKEMIDFYNKLDIYVSTSLSDGGLSSIASHVF